MIDLATAIKCLTQQCDGLLCARYPNDSAQRKQLIEHFLRHELASTTLENISQSDWQAVSNRCLFFACQEVLPAMTRRYLFDVGDMLLQEEINHYVLDRLLQDDFRRIGNYDSQNSASFRTYIHGVVHNLALDYLRKRSRENKVIDRYTEYDEVGGSQDGDEQQFFDPATHEPLPWIKQLLDDKSDPESSSLQQRIAQHLSLDIKQRLFLKAIYFADLSAEQAGQLPGMEMNKHQANSLHRRLLARLAEVFKQAGLYDDLQQLVVQLDALQTVQIGDLNIRVAIQNIILMIKKSGFTECYFECKKTATKASIATDYLQLRKRWYNIMIDIRSDAMAGEGYLQWLDKKQKKLSLRYLDKAQTVQARYMKKLSDFVVSR